MPLKVKNKNVAELIEKFIEDGLGIDDIMLRFRNSVIVHAMTLTEGNVTHAARVLKTGRENMYRWIKEYEVREKSLFAIHNRTKIPHRTDLSTLRIIHSWFT